MRLPFSHKFIICATLMLAPATAFPQNGGNFFAGKQVSLYIGSTTGGGYDLYGRLVAQYLSRHIPGDPTVVVKNMPGAGGLLVANYIFNQAAKDGTEIGEPQNGTVFEKLFQTLSPGGAAAHFDATKFGWLGSAAQTVFVFVTWKTSPVKTFQQALHTPVVMAATGKSSDDYLLAIMSNRIFGTKFKIVSGYPGSSQADLAMQSGEAQGEAGKDWTTITSAHPNWLRDHDVNILLQLGTHPLPGLRNVPFALNLAPNAEDKKILEVIFAKYGMSRPFLAPPGLPPARLRTLRRAFDDTMKDPNFLAEAKKVGADINPVSGQEVEALVTKIMNTPPALAARVREVISH